MALGFTASGLTAVALLATGLRAEARTRPLHFLQQLASPGSCEAIWPRPTLAWDSSGTREATLAALRDAARATPDDGERWLAYGLHLTLTTGERTADWRERVEAEQALERAFDLLPKDPRPTAALAVLKRKQGARVDARRLIRRARGMVASSNHALDACYEAELYYQMALIHRTWWDDWDGMTFMGGSIGSLKSCSRETVQRDQDNREEKFCANTYYDIMRRRADLTPMRHDDRDAVIENLEAAIAADPTHRDARRALFLALYELPDSAGFGRATRAGLAADPTDPWLHLWGATEAFARRDIDQSVEYLHRALAFLPAEERAVLLSPTRIVPRDVAERWEPGYDSTYWRAADPMFLTDENERLLAHVARVTYAAAKFDVPLLAAIGPDTPAGDLLVRYGRPWRRWMYATENEGGAVREVVWAMDSVGPPLFLQRPLTMRRWKLVDASAATVHANQARLPERWDPLEAFARFDSLPVQAARFEEGGNTVLDLYALWRNPYPDTVPDTLRVGFFVRDQAMQSLVDRRRTLRGRADPLPLRFRAPLSPAFYWYGVETLAGPSRAAGRARGGLRVVPPALDSLRTSDLLLGRASREPPATIPHRDSLQIEPVYDLLVTPGDPLVVYWETYGLRPDSTGEVRYRVAVEAREADRGVVANVIARLGAAIGVGRRAGVTVEWDVQAPAPDGVRRDVLVIDPAGWPAGSYRLRVRIEESATGRASVTERAVTKPEP